MLPHIAVLSSNPKVYDLLTQHFPGTIQLKKQNQCLFHKAEKFVLMMDSFNKHSLRNRINLLSQADAAFLEVNDVAGVDKRLSDYLELLSFFHVPLVGILYDTKMSTDLLDTAILSVQDMIEKKGLTFGKVSLICTDVEATQLPENIDLIREALETACIQPQSEHTIGTLVIDSIYPRLASTLVAGKMIRGSLETGDPVVISGYGRQVMSNISSIQSYRDSITKTRTGEHVGLVLAGVSSKDVGPNQAVAKRTYTPADAVQLSRFKANLSLNSYREFGRTTPFADGYMPVFWFRGIPVRGVISILDGSKFASPGQYLEVSVVLEHSIPWITRPFIVTDEDKLVGTGKVTTEAD